MACDFKFIMRSKSLLYLGKFKKYKTIIWEKLNKKDKLKNGGNI